MKLDLNVSTINVFKIEFNTNDLVANANANANDLYFENQGCYKKNSSKIFDPHLLKNFHLRMHRNEIFCT